MLGWLTPSGRWFLTSRRERDPLVHTPHTSNSCIDGGGEGVDDMDDRRISLEEWVGHYHTVRDRGFKALSDWALSSDLTTEEKVKQGVGSKHTRF